VNGLHLLTSNFHGFFVWIIGTVRREVAQQIFARSDTALPMVANCIKVALMTSQKSL